MTDEAYAEALEAERAARNDRARYIVVPDGDAFHLTRRNGARQAWGIARYISQDSAELAAAFLNRLKEDEA